MDTRMLLNPKYIHTVIKEISLKDSTTSSGRNGFLFLSAHNTLVNEELVGNFFEKFNLRPAFVELIFFELLLLFDSCTEALTECTLFNNYSEQTLKAALQGFGEYKNAVKLLIELYCEEDLTRDALTLIDEEWVSFITILRETDESLLDEMTDFNTLPEEFSTSVFTWDCFKNVHILSNDKKELQGFDQSIVKRLTELKQKIENFSQINISNQKNIDSCELRGKVFKILEDIEKQSKEILDELQKMSSSFDQLSDQSSSGKTNCKEIVKYLKTIVDHFEKSGKFKYTYMPKVVNYALSFYI